MRTSKSGVIAVAFALHAVVATAARVDMDDPRRVLGRDDDIRIDAELLQDTVSAGGIVGVTYQVENLTKAPVAVADKVCDVSYDTDTRTITVGLGSEVPADGVMPRLVVIAPGEKRTFTGGGALRVAASTARSPFTAVPRLVQIKVTVLRDVASFAQLIQLQSSRPAPVSLTDAQFEKWLESNDTIFLNTIPVQFDSKGHGSGMDVEQRASAAYH